MAEPLMEMPLVDPDLLATLPPVLRAVVKALGFARAKEFLFNHGGVRAHVGKFHSYTLGLNDAELDRLRANLLPHLDENNNIWLPKVDKLLIIVRNAQIRRDAAHESGTTQARQYNLTRRQISNIRNEREDDTRRAQIDLF